MSTLRTLAIAAALVIMATSAAGAPVFANGASPGDSFTNATGTNTGQAVVGSGWRYNNVRNNGIVGINTNLPRSGNGSAYMESTAGPGGASSKADIEYFASSATNPSGNYYATSALGTLGSLTGLRYDWYRMSGGTAAAHLHPVIRLQVFSPDYTKSGYLVFEREVSRDDFGHPAPIVAPTNTWVTDDVFAGNYRMWSTGNTLPFNLNGTNGAAKYYDALRIQDWISSYGSYLVTGVSLGVGSGWGTFRGAVDNVAFSFGGENAASYDSNFELSPVVPAPAAALLGLIGLGSAAWMKRRSN